MSHEKEKIGAAAVVQSRLVAMKDRKRYALYDSVIDTIGQTPIIKLSSKLSPYDGIDIYVKCESHNPGGSLKDRLAAGVIEWAENHGHLSPGQTVVEASSGNTGISMAMVCARKGYSFVCVMSEAFSIERRKLMRFLGAKVILTSKEHNATGMVMKAKELAIEHGFFFANQFENEANAWIHEQTTGVEIIEAFEDSEKQIDHIVLPYGSGGTLLGVSRVLRKRSPQTKIHICEPTNAPMLYSEVETKYPSNGYPSTSFDASHPVWRPHLLQGWATDFIPKNVAIARDSNCYDDIIHVDGDEAIKISKQLAIFEGIFSGISGGGVLSAALKVAQADSSKKGINVLAMIPDTGERYLSTPLFDNIPTYMSAEENYLDVTTPSELPPKLPLPQVTPEATEYINRTNLTNTVVVWSLQYCELCLSLTRFLNEIDIKYKRIDLDSIKLVKNDVGNKYRAALKKVTKSSHQPPFLFVNGRYLGELMDVLNMWKDGHLMTLLFAAGLNPYPISEVPFCFLPNWMNQEGIEAKEHGYDSNGQL